MVARSNLAARLLSGPLQPPAANRLRDDGSSVTPAPDAWRGAILNVPVMNLRPILAVGLLVAAACGEETPTSVPPSTYLVLHLTPSEGTLTWAPGPEGTVVLEPSLSWDVQFVLPENDWIFVVVQLLDPDGRACLESHRELETTSRRGFLYGATANTFYLGSGPSCGSAFAATHAEVALRSGSTSGTSKGQIRVPCSYQFVQRAS